MMRKSSTVTNVTKRYLPIKVTHCYRRYQALPPFRGWVTLVTLRITDLVPMPLFYLVGGVVGGGYAFALCEVLAW